MPYKYPTIPAEDVLFREQFINVQYVTDNGGSFSGTPSMAQNIITFNGVDEKVTYNKSLDIGLRDFSISGRFLTNSKTGSPRITGTRVGTEGVDVYLDATTGKISFYLSDAGAGTIFGFNNEVDRSDGNPYFFTISFDRDNRATLYVNGLLVGTSTAVISGEAGSLDTAEVWIGDFSTGWFNGQIGEIVYYSKALTAEEINDIYTQQTFGEVKIDQLEFFLALRTHYNNGTTELTPNTGVIGDDTIRWGDGSTSSTYPTLLPNNGVSFDGGDYIYINNPLILANTDTFCLGCLFRSTDTNTVYMMDCREAGNEGFGVAFVGGKIRAFTDAGGVGNWAQTDGTYVDDQWHSCIVNFSENGANTDIAIYIDGELAKSDTINKFTTTDTTGAKPVLGAIYTRGSNFYVGDMKFPFLWRFDLTPTQARWQHFKLFRELNI